jgi:hypothetical protein
VQGSRDMFHWHNIAVSNRGMPIDFHSDNNDLGHKAGKMEIPPFDGEAKYSAKACV